MLMYLRRLKNGLSSVTFTFALRIRRQKSYGVDNRTDCSQVRHQVSG